MRSLQPTHVRAKPSVEELLRLVSAPLLERLDVRYQVSRDTNVRLPGSTVFMCVLNTLLNGPVVTQRMLEEHAERALERTGGPGHTCDHSSFGKALARIPCAYFADVLAALRTALEARLGVEPMVRQARGLHIRRIDATVVSLSSKLLHHGMLGPYGKGGGPHANGQGSRRIKSVLELPEEGLPTVLRVCTQAKGSSDCVALGDAMLAACQPGDVWLFDAGCHDRQRLLGLHRLGGWFVTPQHAQHTFKVHRPLWEANQAVQAPGSDAGGELSTELAQLPLPSEQPDKPQEPALRLLRAQQVTFYNSQPGKVRDRLQAMPLVLVQAARWDVRTQRWTPWGLLSNLPVSEDGLHVGPFTFEELCALYRLRWDIEVLFKLLKQHLSFAHLTSRDPNGICSMVYMSVAAALLLIWYRHRTGIDRGWRSVKFWLAENVREWTAALLRQPHVEPG